jgi:N-dimethylarginine dimethylaminohydrolase
MPEFGVPNEVGELRRVLVHRPGKELEIANLNPPMHHFESQVDVKRFQSHHRMMTEALIDSGVEVLDIGTLVADDPFASKLIQQSPNLVYTRDTSTITDAGAILFRMGLESRRYETPIIKAAHLAAGTPIAHYTPEEHTLEGGSFILLEGRVALAALTPRVTQGGIEDLQSFLLNEQLVDQFIQINPPKTVSHIDTEFTELHRKIALFNSATLEANPATIFTRSETWTASFLEWLRDNAYDIIEINTHERDEMACDLLTIDEALILHSTSNDHVIGEIRERGIEVIQIPGNEFVKGNGGVHCMTCPILRV